MALNKPILYKALTLKSSIAVIVITILFILIFLLGSFKFILPSFENQIMQNTIDDAARVSNHLIKVYERDKGFSHMQTMKNDLKLNKIRFFDSEGKILYSTDEKEIGTINKKPYYKGVVAKGEVFYKIVHKGTKSLDGRTINTDVAEIYIPIMKDKTFLYSFEVYYDITKKVQHFEELTFKIKILTYCVIALVFIVIFIRFYTLYADLIIQEQLNKSEKLASLGEMIGNIAHQWRQPLQAISVITQKLQITNMLNGTVTQEEIDDMSQKVSIQVNYLTNTIETFRNFVKEDKIPMMLSLHDEISSSLNIVQTVFSNNQITLQNNINYDDPIEMRLIQGELPQVLVNIFNNAKDVFKERHVENPTVTLNLAHDDKKATIEIEDNAGGIPEDVLPKIFDPYFTTKHQSQGTGLGLHMSYRIITESLHGNLYVQNSDIGAKFIIELPLNNS